MIPHTKEQILATVTELPEEVIKTQASKDKENESFDVRCSECLMAMGEYSNQESAKVFEFAQWASSSDWTYLPSKKLWYNEEDEQNITPLTTEKLFQLFAEQTSTQ